MRRKDRTELIGKSFGFLTIIKILDHVPNKRSEKHGLSRTRIYKTYTTMLSRCYDPTRKKYESYGGRGIAVCDEWKNDFLSFYNWAMANGYQDDLQIDRIENDGNYEPGNCKWSTRKEQANNRRDSRHLTYKNQTKTLSQWAEIFGFDNRIVWLRLKRGWSIEKALETAA